MLTQLSLLSTPAPRPRLHVFDGETFEPAKDSARLNTQLQRVFALLRDGQWRTLAEIHEAVGGSEAGISARCRDLRKPHCGSHEVQRARQFGGVFVYRLKVNPDGVGRITGE